MFLSAYGGTIDPNDWTWPSILTLAMPIVAVASLATLVLMLLLKQWRAALIVAAGIVVSLPSLRLLTPVTPWHSMPSQPGDTLKVLTMNVGLFDWTGTNPNTSMRYILDQDADIVVMQEAANYYAYEDQKTLKALIDELHEKYPYRRQGRFDIGILSKYPYTTLPDLSYKQNGAMAWDVEAPGGTLRVISIHLRSFYLSADDRQLIDSINTPSGRAQRAQSVVSKLGEAFVGHARQARDIRAVIDSTPGDVLVMGDMNDTPASHAYRVLCGNDLHDAWAEAGRGRPYTFHGNHLFVRIDHILYRGNLSPISCRCVKTGDSDHYPMVANFLRHPSTQ